MEYNHLMSNLRTYVTPDATPPRPLETIETRLAKDSEKPVSDFYNNANLQVWPIDPSKMINFFISSPWLTAIDNLLTDSIKSADYELVPLKKGDTISDADMQTATDWLDREDFGIDGITELNMLDFIAAGGSSKLKTGNLFNDVMRSVNLKEVRHLSRLAPQYCRYETSDHKLTLLHQNEYSDLKYLIQFGTRETSEMRHEFLHFREPNDFSAFYGIPDWYGAQDAVEADTAHDKYLKTFFSNHGTPRYLIALESMPLDPMSGVSRASDPEVDTWFNGIVNFFSANKGEMTGRNYLTVTPDGYKIVATPLDNRLDDPTFPNTSKETRRKILATMHISAINLGDTDSANRSNSEEQTDNLISSVLLPFAKPQLNLINKVLRHERGLNVPVKVKLKFDRTDQILERFKTIVLATGRPVLSVPEGRALGGYSRDADGPLVTPSNMLEAFEIGENEVDA